MRCTTLDGLESLFHLKSNGLALYATVNHSPEASVKFKYVFYVFQERKLVWWHIHIVVGQMLLYIKDIN